MRSPDDDDQTLHPERALLTPIWLGSLALLVANDHWLKGADLIPGVLTGKLSDFAGLLMAPVLLATLARVRTRAGLLGCHLAVGVVFAAIQLSPGFAGLWSAAMGLLGHPWVITCDPGDLVALPCLWLSYRLLTPAMAADRPALVGLQRSAVAGVSVFGLWATVATSDDGDSSLDDECGDGCWDTDDGSWDEGEDEPTWEDVYGQVYIHNPNNFTLNLNIRTLRPDVNLDCQAIAEDPGRLLANEAFGETEHWALPPTTNVGVWMPQPCGAAKIAGEGIPEQIIFSTQLGSEQWFDGSLPGLAQLTTAGAAIVIGEAGGEWVGGESWRHTPSTDSPPEPEDCQAPAGESHLDWSEIPNHSIVEIEAITVGLDGCHELELLPWTGADIGEPFGWYLCAPEASLRLEVGEFYVFDELGETLEARLVDPDTHEVLVDDLDRPLRTLRWERALSHAGVLSPGILVTPVELPMCPWQVADNCLEVSRRLDLRLGDDLASPGEPAVYVDPTGIRHELILARARSLALTAGECGSAQLPHDIDYALISEPQP